MPSTDSVSAVIALDEIVLSVDGEGSGIKVEISLLGGRLEVFE